MQNVTMIRLPAAQACYIAHSIDDAIKPADLREALELVRECSVCSSIYTTLHYVQYIT